MPHIRRLWLIDNTLREKRRQTAAGRPGPLFPVAAKQIVAAGNGVAEAILSHAADSSADIIVMGGYGHARLREFVLGGATRGTLAAMTVATLMSH